jgi:hypothetical protein
LDLNVNRGRISIAFVAAGLALFGGVARAGEVSLTMRSAGDRLSLNCVFLFAHWITEESGPVAPGAERVFALHVAPGDGTVTMTNATGVPMALERIICGASGNWEAGQYLLPLYAIRDAGSYLELVCRDDGGIACKLVQAGASP